MFLNIGNRLSHLFQIGEFDFLSIGFTLLCSFTSQSTFLSVFWVKADNVMMRLNLIEFFIFMVIADVLEEFIKRVEKALSENSVEDKIEKLNKSIYNIKYKKMPR